ncbi:hypothetical protein PHISCL_03858 [Aspergillus sclerotialis]|uniref:Uncharacterized protein n=1 Tax=Aspergillus sclerotialis TaxID=2070753 RepID=A0A3A2ZQU7_9EURO|nr:hypothetical protein PHISCL_03858 [Aspergillus sclerotialis]
MIKPPLAQIVYSVLFPRPTPRDPGSFAAFITRDLVPEVRLETATFYGSLDCLEAQYPGLDYTYPPHRMRLSRYPWHCRLFKVFDALKLTDNEISSLCRWEGTKSARERYEKEEGVTVHDTTAAGVAVDSFIPPSIHVHIYTDEDDALPAMENESKTDSLEDETISLASSLENESSPEPSEEESAHDNESIGVALSDHSETPRRVRRWVRPRSIEYYWELFLKDSLGIPIAELDTYAHALPPAWIYRDDLTQSQISQLVTDHLAELRNEIAQHMTRQEFSQLVARME